MTREFPIAQVDAFGVFEVFVAIVLVAEHLTASLALETTRLRFC